jgi:hypothetical protein
MVAVRKTSKVVSNLKHTYAKAAAKRSINTTSANPIVSCLTERLHTASMVAEKYFKNKAAERNEQHTTTNAKTWLLLKPEPLNMSLRKGSLVSRSEPMER